MTTIPTMSPRDGAFTALNRLLAAIRRDDGVEVDPLVVESYKDGIKAGLVWRKLFDHSEDVFPEMGRLNELSIDAYLTGQTDLAVFLRGMRFGLLTDEV